MCFIVHVQVFLARDARVARWSNIAIRSAASSQALSLAEPIVRLSTLYTGQWSIKLRFESLDSSRFLKTIRKKHSGKKTVDAGKYVCVCVCVSSVVKA